MPPPPNQPYLADWVEEADHILYLSFLTHTLLNIFVLKNGGKLYITVTGPRRYSVDLKQGGLELPANFCFTSLNENHWKRCRSMRSKRKNKSKKKKRKRKRNLKGEK